MPNNPKLVKTFLRHLVDWFYALPFHRKFLIRCRHCQKTKVISVLSCEYFTLLNDTERGPWSWRAVNKQRKNRMKTEHICRSCVELNS